MQSKTLVVLSAVAILGLGSTAMAKGGGGSGGGGGKGGSSHGGMHGHGHFDHDHFRNRFLRNQFLFGGGWGWGNWGSWPYDNSGGSNTTVVVFPQAVPQAAKGDPAPCNWNQQEFKVQSSAGGTRPVQVVSCH
jgi:hypothetical protein